MVVVEEKDRAAPQNNWKPGINSLLLGSGPELPAAPASLNTTTTTAPRCPECGSQRVWKDGIRYTFFGEIQRYLCRNCYYRFSHTEGSEPSEHLQKLHTLILKSKADKTILCRVVDERNDSCKELGSPQQMKHIRSGRATVLLTERAKKLAEVETRTQEKAAGATKDPATLKGKLVEFSLWLSKQGHDEDLVKWRTAKMKRLIALGADLWNPETVKEILAKQKAWTDGYKMLLSYTYESFLKMEGLTWQRPHYKQEESYPFIPREPELNQLIATAGKKLGTFLQGLKDTGADPGELAKLQWKDVNTETRAIQIRPVKGHTPRILKTSQQFIDRLQRFPKTEPIFRMKSLNQLYVGVRKTAIEKFANPRLRNISFRTFRHWKGTMEYHRTRDLLYVQKILGHKQIRNTLKYIHLEAMLFPDTDDQYTVKVASNVKEATSLIEVGFEYVTGEYHDGGKIFRKRSDGLNFVDKAKTIDGKTLSHQW